MTPAAGSFATSRQPARLPRSGAGADQPKRVLLCISDILHHILDPRLMMTTPNQCIRRRAGRMCVPAMLCSQSCSTDGRRRRGWPPATMAARAARNASSSSWCGLRAEQCCRVQLPPPCTMRLHVASKVAAPARPKTPALSPTTGSRLRHAGHCAGDARLHLRPGVCAAASCCARRSGFRRLRHTREYDGWGNGSGWCVAGPVRQSCGKWLGAEVHCGSA